MKKLEFECTNCQTVLVIDLSEKDYQYYTRHHSFEEGSEAYYDFFSGSGWVLQQAVFCDICKYDHSEVYRG
jgi:hypothetical protein